MRIYGSVIGLLLNLTLARKVLNPLLFHFALAVGPNSSTIAKVCTDILPTFCKTCRASAKVGEIDFYAEREVFSYFINFALAVRPYKLLQLNTACSKAFPSGE